MSAKTVLVGEHKRIVGGSSPFILIAGPCVIEGPTMAHEIAQALKKITDELGIFFIFKASYDKANRTSGNSFRGLGKQKGLQILRAVKEALDIPILSDVHCVEEVQGAADVLDVIQIPALLCRQTDLVQAAAKTGKPVNIKKGSFLSPREMWYVVEKVIMAGSNQIMLTERGTVFGYNNLVVDFRSFAIMKEIGYPVIFDATHSVQLPGADGSCSGGSQAYIPLLTKAAIAAGVDGIFLEVHPDPKKALCDGPNSFPLEKVQGLLERLLRIEKGLDNKSA